MFTRVINQSTVKRSGIEQTLFTVCIIDLQPLGSSNITNMLVTRVYSCQRNVTYISEDFKSLLKWTDENKLKVNMSKSK